MIPVSAPADDTMDAPMIVPRSLVYTCGAAVSVWEKRAHAAKSTTPPPRFLETMQSYLTTLGVPRDRIKIEAFG